MRPLSDSARVVIVLTVAGVLVVAVAALSFLYNNDVLISITGIIVGATFALIGNVINAAWVEPLKRKQERKEKELDKNRDRADLRRALYFELISLVYGAVHLVASYKDAVKKRDDPFLESTEKTPTFLKPTLSVYDHLKKDPIALYQLEDARRVEISYIFANSLYNDLEVFEHSTFRSVDDAESAVRRLTYELNRLVDSIDLSLDYTKGGYTPEDVERMWGSEKEFNELSERWRNLKYDVMRYAPKSIWRV